MGSDTRRPSTLDAPCNSVLHSSVRLRVTSRRLGIALALTLVGCTGSLPPEIPESADTAVVASPSDSQAGSLSAEASPAVEMPDDRAGHVDNVALDYAVDHLTGRYMSMDAIWLDDHLREALWNVEFSIDGSAAQPAYGGVVQGRVTAVAEGASYRDEVGPDGARSAQLPFDSPDATWRMIVLTIDVENDFDPTTEAPETVRLGVTFDGGADAKSMLSAFEGQHVLAVLDRPGAFSADQTVRTAARSGALLGFVAEDGSISMPLLGEEERDYLIGLTTIDAVIEESEKPRSIINVTFDGGYQRGG